MVPSSYHAVLVVCPSITTLRLPTLSYPMGLNMAMNSSARTPLVVKLGWSSGIVLIAKYPLPNAISAIVIVMVSPAGMGGVLLEKMMRVLVVQVPPSRMARPTQPNH